MQVDVVYLYKIIYCFGLAHCGKLIKQNIAVLQGRCYLQVKYKHYWAVQPASTGRATPVNVRASSEARNKAALASSSIDTNSFTACFSSITFSTTSFSDILCSLACS